MKLTTMIKLFGSASDRKKNLNLCHQDLLEREGTLARFENLPMGAFVMFVSHQWNGSAHPSPNGVQISCMVKTFRRLRDGKIDRVDTDPFHSLLYKSNHVTHRQEWMQLLSKAYIFYDFWSQPQPYVEPENSPRRTKLEQDLKMAIASMGAYVERSDCLVVLVPGARHVDRINPHTGRHEFTCYRTYRRRAFCVMEMTAANLSRRKTHPMLLIRSSEGAPQWVSSLESHKLAVGESNFTCCEKNHKGVFEKCDRDVARDVLERMIMKKVEHLFDLGNVVLARLTLSQTSWFLRGLSYENVQYSEKDVREQLRWDENVDGDWFDRGGVSILIYAVGSNQILAVKSLMKHLDDVTSKKEQMRLLISAVPREGFVEAGITGKMNALSVAMFMGSPEIVEMLLDRGFDPMLSDIAGNHPFLFACISNRVENVKLWLKRFPEWNLEAPNRVVGGVALGCALYIGPNRLELVQLLIEKGACTKSSSWNGTTHLIAQCANEDADPKVLELLLSCENVDINAQIRGKTLKWKGL